MNSILENVKAKAKPGNAVVYARYSSHGQTEQSIEGQLHDAHEFARLKGLTIIGEYIDRALTGTKDTRPGFQRMIADAENREFSTVIVWKLDRFARNRYDSSLYKAKLHLYGVKVVSVKENISDSAEGIILEGMLESLAEYYSVNLSQNVRRGQRENIRKGRYCGGVIPYGYKSVDGKLVADEKTAPVIKYIFSEYAAGVPKKKIVEELNRRGVRSPLGKKIGITTFQYALTSTAYIGEYVYNGEVVPGLAEPLIDKETFMKVQENLKRHRHAPGASRAEVPYYLHGKVFCGLCGEPMVGESGRSHTGETYHYYACSGRKKAHTCDKKSEKKDYLERYVIKQTVSYVLAPDQLDRIADAVFAEYKKEFNDSAVRELERQVERIDREIDKLVDLAIDAPDAARRSLYDKIEALGVEKDDYEADLIRMRRAVKIPMSKVAIIAFLKDMAEGDIDDEDFRRRLIDTFVSRVFVYPDRFVVFYNLRRAQPVSFTELPASETGSEPEPLVSSDNEVNGEPTTLISEPCFVFVRGIFGMVFFREPA